MTSSMKKILGSVKKKAGLDNKKEGKDGKEIKDKPVVAEEPSVILEEDILLEETSEEVLLVDGQLATVITTLREALKRVSGSTRQLISVGKHFSTIITDTAIGKQLVAGYENLNAWSEVLIVDTKKLAPPLQAIKVVTIKKLVKICKYLSLATTILLVAVKSVAAFDAENQDVQKQVAMSTRAIRDAIQQLVAAWDHFPSSAIVDLDVVGQIGATAKQIVSMCDNVEAASGIAVSNIVTLSSTRSELIAACRATAAATTRLIYSKTEKYTSITPATTTLKVIISSTTQVLTVTAIINSILFKADEASPLKSLLTSAALTLKKAVDKLEDSGKESSQRFKAVTANGESVEVTAETEVVEQTEPIDPEAPVLMEEPSKLTTNTRSVSAPVVSLSGTTLVNVKRAFTTAPTVARSSTPMSPQRSQVQLIESPELFDALHEIQALIDKQAADAACAVPDTLIFNRKKANSVEESGITPNSQLTFSLVSSPQSSSPILGSSASSYSPSPSPSPSPIPSLNSSAEGLQLPVRSTTPKPLPPIPTRHPLPPTPPIPSHARANSADSKTAKPSNLDAPSSNSNSNSTDSTETNSTNNDSNGTTENKLTQDSDKQSLSRSGNSVPQGDSPSPRSPHVSPREGQPAPASPAPVNPRDPTTPSELNEMLSWSGVRAESARNPRISMRMGPVNPLSPVLSSPPLSPSSMSPPAVAHEPVHVPVRKASRKEDMTLSKLFGVISGGKDEQPMPHASKKLLKKLVALVAAYSSAIDMGIAEIKDIAARAQSEMPRPSSSFNLALDPNASVPIKSQYLTDALQTIEAGIPTIPPTPPPPQLATPSDAGRQSGDAGCEIWSEPPDEENVNVLFNEAGKIRAGTLNKLVERLTSPTEADLKFMKTFITTYRSFCTPETLLQKIMQRFDVPESEAASELPIRLRVCNVLKQWVGDQYKDFDQQLIETLTAFIEAKLVNHKSYKTFATSILNTIAAKKQSNDIPRVVLADLRTDSKGIQLSPSRLLFVFDEEEIAKQLTLIDFSIYSAIQPVELLNLAWNTPKYKYRAPHVMALIARANLLSNWVASVILWQTKLKDRVKVMTKMISIAKHLRDLNNFNSLVAVIAGLNNSSIHRLKFTREELSKQSQETFKELEEVMNVNAAYRTYRALLRNVNPPCLPFLGVYLTDLTFVEEGNPDFIKTLINFGKRELVHNILAEIQQYQLTPYVFPLVDNIASFLDQLPHILGDKDMYNLSLLREPREATRESIV